MEDILTAAGYILLFVLVLVAAYFATKWIGKRYSAQAKAGRNMKVLERMALGSDRTLFIVQVGEKTLLLGITAQRVELLCELDPDELALDDTPSGDTSFSAVFRKTLKNSWGIGRKGGDDPHGGD